jgi:hypothetical protein
LPEFTLIPTVKARLLQPWEKLSKKFDEPLTKSLSLNSDWIWVAVTEEEIIGFLVACECHGAAFVLRIRMTEQAPVAALLVLLRQFFQDAASRGLKGFVITLDHKSYVERRIGRIMKNSFKAAVTDATFYMASAEFPKEEL